MSRIAAVLLAAGESRRMGRPKLALPWGNGGSLISQVAERFLMAGADPVLVITGGDREAVERALAGSPARCLFNPDYRRGGMLSSIRVGLRHLEAADAEAALLAPADLPYLTVKTIAALIARRHETGADLIAPSYRMRRGHPALIGRPVWREVLELPEGVSLRDFLNRPGQRIDYVLVEDPGVVRDVDTPEDYRKGMAD